MGEEQGRRFLPTSVIADEPPLVGRETEVGAIGAILGKLDQDRTASLLQVAGEAGIGKSRLLGELAAAAGSRGHLVLASRAADFEAELPFGLFSDALDDWLLARTPGELATLAGGQEDDLAVVLHGFERLAARRTPEIQQERARAYRAVRTLLTQLASSAPLVLLLDDVQWADPGSLELLCHLLAHPPRGAVLLALGFRPAQVPARLSAALAGALRTPQAWRFDLMPLSAEHARGLLGPAVPSSTQNRLYRESGGNPFFLIQLARGARFRRSGRAQVPGASAVPGPVRAALATELSSLSAPALVLLQGAAVAGDPFEAMLAARAADVGEPGSVDLLDELLQFELVTPTAVPGEFAFRHPIVRAAVADLSAASWTVRAHARLAAVLAERGATSSAQAPHVERAARKGDTGAVELLVDAADASAPRAPALAARWYGAALRLLPDGPTWEAKGVELRLAKATALAGSGQLQEACGTLVDLLDRLPTGHPARVPVVAFCAGVEHLLGRHRAADRRLARALADVPDSASVEAIQLTIELAAGDGYQNRPRQMLARAEQAFEAATALGERNLAVVASGQRALASYFLGVPADEVLDGAAAAMDALDDDELAGRLDLGLWIGWSEAVLERYERSVDHCQRVIDVSRATGQGAFLLVTMTAQAWSLVRLGRLAEADDLLANAIEAGYLAPNLFLSVAVGLSTVVATCQGRYEAAVRAGEESVRLANEADPGLIPGMSGLYHAIPLIELGKAREARETLLAMSGGDPGLRTSRSGDAAAYEVLTRADLALGNMDGAREWARRATAATRGGHLAGEAAFARRAIAHVTLAYGDGSGAAESVLDGALRAERAGAPLEAARCRIVAGRALLRANQRERAAAELERAASDLSRMGAHGYRIEAERELRRLGRRVARRPRAGDPATSGLRSLTERERELAELVRQGLTNRQIATATFNSEKTIERHLSRIFAKLGVSTRTALALLVAADSEG